MAADGLVLSPAEGVECRGVPDTYVASTVQRHNREWGRIDEGEQRLVGAAQLRGTAGDLALQIFIGIPELCRHLVECFGKDTEFPLHTGGVYFDAKIAGAHLPSGDA